MTPDASPRSPLEPAASLTSVRVKRRNMPIAPSGKRGDLTAGGETQGELEAAGAPAPVIVLPPPPPLAAEQRETALPLAEVLLPELAAKREPDENDDAADAIALPPDPLPEMPVLEMPVPEMPVPERALAPIEPERPEEARQPEPAAEREPAEEADATALSPAMPVPEMPMPEPALPTVASEEPEEAPQPQAAAERERLEEADVFALLKEMLAQEMSAPEAASAPVEPEKPAQPEAAAQQEPAEEPDAIALLPELVLPEMPLPEPAPAPVEPEPAEEAPQPLLLLSERALDETPSPPAGPPLEPPEAEGAEDIVDYWDGLRGARAFPALDDIDRARVAATWPNTVLVAVESSELPRITPLGRNNGEIEYTATVIDWIVARSRSSARRGEPTEAEQRFAISSGGARYYLLMLPVGGDERKSDHVLCQISRMQEMSAVASFRRWLTG